MKNVFASVVAAALAATASAKINSADFISIESLNTNEPFTITAGYSAPDALQNLGNATFLNGELGFYPNGTAQALQLVGQSVYAAGHTNDSSSQLYLRPTHGTPEYFTLLGSPSSDAVPALVLANNFSIAATLTDGSNTPTFYLGAEGEMENWTACGSGDSWAIYYGWGPGLSGCTDEGFSLIMTFESSDDNVRSM